MAINFPSSPTLGEQYTYNSRTWEWDGTAWNAVATTGAILPLSAGGTGAALSDPGADRLVFWDDSANSTAWLAPSSSSGLIVDTTTLKAAAPLIMAPAGRLTPSTAVPFVTSNVSAATTMYWTPYKGQYAPLYDGTRWGMVDYGGELSQTLADSTKSPAATVAEAVYDVYLWSDSGTYRATRGPAWIYTSTVTFTDAGDLVNWTSHGLTEGMPIVFTTTGALPTGITAGTVYYVTRSPSTNTFTVSTSIANAAAGTINTFSGTGSGTNTATVRVKSRGTGAATSELESLSGFLVNKYDITNGPAAQRGLYLGSFRTNPSNQVSINFGGADTTAQFSVWNMYNRGLSRAIATISTSSWSYTTSTWRVMNSTVAARVEFLVGVQEEFVTGASSVSVQANGTAAFGVGYDATTADSSGTVKSFTGCGSGGATTFSGYLSSWGIFPSIGLHLVWPLENGVAGATWYGTSGSSWCNGLSFQMNN